MFDTNITSKYKMYFRLTIKLNISTQLELYNNNFCDFESYNLLIILSPKEKEVHK